MLVRRSPSTLKALAIGLGTVLFLRFGLEPASWLFYEASHGLGIDWLYWGYAALRAGGHFFSLMPLQTLICVAIGVLVTALLLWRSREKT